MVDWHSTSLEHAREAQERYGWSDEELVERMLIVRRRLTDAPEAPAPGGSATKQIAWLASRLPPLSGVRGDTDLLSLLADARRPPPGPGSRDARTVPATHAVAVLVVAPARAGAADPGLDLGGDVRPRGARGLAALSGRTLAA